jgi:hypothetical protein
MAMGETALLRVPAITAAQSTTGRESKAFDYTSSAEVPCRFFETAAIPGQRPEGQYLACDAVVQIQAANYSVEPETLTDSSGERRQITVKATPSSAWVAWEVLATRDLGGLGRRKEVRLRRWKQ